MNLKEKIRNLSILDLTLFKWTNIFLGIIIGAYIATFVKTYVVIFFITAILLSLISLYRFFRLFI